MADSSRNSQQQAPLTSETLDKPNAGTPSSRVKPSQWKARPFVLPATACWNVPLQLTQLNALILGFQPLDMDDKWFVYADGPDDEGRVQIHMHRSWTGHKIAQMEISGVKAGEDGASITGLVYETSETITTETSEEEAKRRALNVCSSVLGVTLAIVEEN